MKTRLILILILFLTSCSLNLHLTQDELHEKYGPLEAGESIFDEEEKEDEDGNETGD
jgi:hypothetical protein